MDEQSIFLAALEKPSEELSSWLAGACGENTEMRVRIEALLQQQENAGSFLERPAMHMETTAGISVLQSLSVV